MNDEYEGFCINCDRIVPLIFKRRMVEQTEYGISFSYTEDYAICVHCGDKVYVPRLYDRNAKVRASAQYALDLIYKTLVDDKEDCPYLTTLPESTKQINSIMLEIILRKYSRKYRRYLKSLRRSVSR